MNKFIIMMLMVVYACSPGTGNTTYQNLSSTDQVKFDKYMILGKKLFDVNCANCHQTNGLGLKGLIPPLAKADYLKNNQSAIPCLLKMGTVDSLVVNGHTYPPNMPAHPLTNLELAEIITYVNNSWGNEYGFLEVKDFERLLEHCN